MILRVPSKFKTYTAPLLLRAAKVHRSRGCASTQSRGAGGIVERPFLPLAHPFSRMSFNNKGYAEVVGQARNLTGLANLHGCQPGLFSSSRRGVRR
jgi:hypothetical protein